MNSPPINCSLALGQGTQRLLHAVSLQGPRSFLHFASKRVLCVGSPAAELCGLHRSPPRWDILYPWPSPDGVAGIRSSLHGPVPTIETAARPDSRSGLLSPSRCGQLFGYDIPGVPSLPGSRCSYLSQGHYSRRSPGVHRYFITIDFTRQPSLCLRCLLWPSGNCCPPLPGGRSYSSSVLHYRRSVM